MVNLGDKLVLEMKRNLCHAAVCLTSDMLQGSSESLSPVKWACPCLTHRLFLGLYEIVFVKYVANRTQDLKFHFVSLWRWP